MHVRVQFVWPRGITPVERIMLSAHGDLQRLLRCLFSLSISHIPGSNYISQARSLLDQSPSTSYSRRPSRRHSKKRSTLHHNHHPYKNARSTSRVPGVLFVPQRAQSSSRRRNTQSFSCKMDMPSGRYSGRPEMRRSLS